MQSQQYHFEVVAEKLTVQNFIKPVASKYRIPVVIIRGNSAFTARYDLVQRFKASRKPGLFLLCLGDCDPDGDSIVQTTLKSIRDDFGVSNVDGARVAMTHAQADAQNDGRGLPKNLEAKKSSSNYKKFVAQHGRSDCYELEAVQPQVLQTWLDGAIRGVIDVAVYSMRMGAA